MEEDDDVMNVSHHGRSVISFFLYLLNPAGFFSSIMDIYKYKSADSKPLSVFSYPNSFYVISYFKYFMQCYRRCDF
jgi:hypothetical protein